MPLPACIGASVFPYATCDSYFLFFQPIKEHKFDSPLAFSLTGLREISNMPKFAGNAAFCVVEGCDPETSRGQNRRYGCDCFHKKCSFSRWQVVLFLLVLAVIIIVMGLLIAMFEPGNKNLKYSEKEAIVAPTLGKNRGRLVRVICMETEFCVVFICPTVKKIEKGPS